MLLSFLMEVGRLLPLVSSSGNRTTYTSLSGYEGGVSRSDNVRNVWNVCSSFSILIFNCFLAPDHPELSLLSPAFRTLFWMVCLPWAFTLNGLVHSSFYHSGWKTYVQLPHLPQTFVYFSGHADKFFALDFFHTEVRGQPVNNSHRSCEGFGPYVVTICVTTGLALELDYVWEQFVFWQVISGSTNTWWKRLMGKFSGCGLKWGCALD